MNDENTILFEPMPVSHCERLLRVTSERCSSSMRSQGNTILLITASTDLAGNRHYLWKYGGAEKLQEEAPALKKAIPGGRLPDSSHAYINFTITYAEWLTA
jgi:hypothetical protein